MSEATHGSIEISAAPTRVAAVISDLPNYPQWTEGMTAPAVLETDPAGLPLVAEFDVSAGPIKDRVRLAYSWQPGAVEWRLVQAQSLHALNGRYEWQAIGANTEVRYTLSLELNSHLPSMLRKLAEKTIITSALSGLKRRVEAAG